MILIFVQDSWRYCENSLYYKFVNVGLFKCAENEKNTKVDH